jgi:hypothetical protein
MWGRIVERVRRAGPRKIAIIAIAAAIAVALAYGDNSSNDAAAGATLPKASIGHVTTAATPAAFRATR